MVYRSGEETLITLLNPLDPFVSRGVVPNKSDGVGQRWSLVRWY